jgi:hypothetical protein
MSFTEILALSSLAFDRAFATLLAERLARLLAPLL